MSADLITVSASANVGEAISYRIRHLASDNVSHTHLVTYSIGDFSGTVIDGAPTNAGDAYMSTFILHGNVLPSSMSGTVTLTCTTYDAVSGVPLGSTTATCTLNVPNYSITNEQISGGITKVNEKLGYYLQGISTLTAYATYSPKANYNLSPYIRFRLYKSDGTLITQSTVRVNSNGYASYTFQQTGNVGDLVVKCYCYDGRNKSSPSAFSTAKQLGSFTAYSYTYPRLDGVLVRCDNDGTENPSGGYVKFVGTAEVTQLGTDNSGVVTASLDGTQVGLQAITAGQSTTLTPYITQKSSSGTGSLYIVDTVGFSTAINLTYSSPSFIVAFSDNAVGVGKVPTANTFDVGIPVNCVDDGVNGFGDIVVAQGHTTNWYWKKWSNGQFEAWYYGESSSTATWSQYYNVYKWNGSDSLFPDLTIPVISIPTTPDTRYKTMAVKSITAVDPTNWLLDVWASAWTVSASNSVQFQVMAPRQHSASQVRVYIYVTGFWK